MNFSNDLSSQATVVLDRAAGTGRNLVSAGHDLVETGRDLVEAGQELVGAAGGLVALAGGLVADVGEAGERAVRVGGQAVEDVAEAAVEHLAPVAASTARTLRRNRLLWVLLSLLFVAGALTFRRRRAERRRQERLRSVTLVSEPATDPIGTS